MTRGVRIRIIAFVVLSAVGVVYVAANYLGIVDRLLDRGLSVEATLPESGGLFVGSEVTYRGVKTGKVSRISVTRKGVELELSLEEGTRLPLDSPMYVHNLSAVGEQYLDFEPTTDQGPYAQDGDLLEGGPESLPVAEEDLLVELDQLVGSVDKKDLQVVVRELGATFRDTGGALQKLLDGGTAFVDEAAANEDETVSLLNNLLTVLDTQQDEGDNIRSFSRDLNLITATLRDSDQDLRQVLQGTPPALREVDTLLQDLEPTLPVLLGNLITVNQVVVSNLAGVEQLLVTFPVVVATGFTGTTPDGYGHVSLNLAEDPQPCRAGFLAPSRWRQGSDLTDGPIFPARCLSDAPFNMRGSKHAPTTGSPGSAYRATYDPLTGKVSGATDEKGNPVRFREQGDLSILGGDAWKWLLAGPVTGQ